MANLSLRNPMLSHGLTRRHAFCAAGISNADGYPHHTLQAPRLWRTAISLGARVFSALEQATHRIAGSDKRHSPKYVRGQIRRPSGGFHALTKPCLEKAHLN
jgi:hypothetical protein